MKIPFASLLRPSISFCALCALFALSACGSSDEASDSAAVPGESTAASDGTASDGTASDGAPGDSATEIEAVSPQEAAALLEANPDLVVLDIRRPEEFAEGHLAGALNIEFGADDFEEELAKLDRDQPYVVHCRSGRRSTESLPVFESLQFRKLYHLDSGMIGWQEAALPVEE